MVNPKQTGKRSATTAAAAMNKKAATSVKKLSPGEMAKTTTKTIIKDAEDSSTSNKPPSSILKNNEKLFRPEVDVPTVSPKAEPTNCLWTLHGLIVSVVEESKTKPIQKAKEELNKQEFFLFMSERQRIFIRRQRGDECWSASPIFQDFAWCNVYRELDRGTQYFRAFVLSIPSHSNINNDPQQRLRKILFASYLYRLVNRIESFITTGFPDETNVKEYLRRVAKVQRSGNKFFTGAHQTTNFVNFAIYVQKVASNLNDIVSHIGAAQSTKELCKLLQDHLPGVGKFMAWQIQCDLQEAKCCHHFGKTTGDEANDGDNLFCELGPGAKAGLMVIFGNTKQSDEEYLNLAQSLVKTQDHYYNKMGIEFPYWNDRKLTIKEIEHALCEYAKFRKVSQTSTGRRYNSRSHLDQDQLCVKCQDNGDDLFLCDMCNQAMCPKCVGTPPDGLYWTCPLCAALEARW